MDSAVRSKLPRFPLNVLLTSFIILLLALTLIGKYELHSIKLMRLIGAKINFSELREQILHDEIAAVMSLKNAVALNDKSRVDYYKHQIDNTVKSNAAELAAINAAIDKMTSMEAQAYQLFKKGKKDAAKNILLGKEFEKQHKIYAAEMVKHNQALLEEAKTFVQKKEQETSYAMRAIYIAIISLFTAGLFIANNIFHLKRIKAGKRRLEELLYEQVNEVHHRPSFSVNVPPALIKAQKNRELFAAELDYALETNQFELYYQPIVNLTDNQIQDVEALVRWQHPTLGLLLPDTFLPLCENNGFIHPLGKWVLKKACEQIKAWHDAGYAKLRVSVNLSAHQLNDPNLINHIQSILGSTNVSAHSLRLEITENVIIQNVENNMQVLKSLRQLGLHLSLDDFGTGYSSLNYLKQFPFSDLKIDKSFIADMTTNITSLAIVEAIINLGKSLGLTLVAEGVETQDQLQLLKKLGCDLIQGYLYSIPLTAENFTSFLINNPLNIYPSREPNKNLQHYHCEILSIEHYHDVVKLVSRTFCEYEPMTKYLGISEQEFLPFVELLVSKAIKDGISIVALHDKQVIACTLVEDSTKPLDISINLDARFDIIFALLEQLSKDFFSERNMHDIRLAHLFITAVDHSYRGKGLSRIVNLESSKLAKQKGFDFMYCEFTHHYNEQGTVKNLINNKFLIRSCTYKEFIFQGKRPFEHLEGAATSYIWELKDGAKLSYTHPNYD